MECGLQQRLFIRANSIVIKEDLVTEVFNLNGVVVKDNVRFTRFIITVERDWQT